eukprot:Skav202733  [mRNA]  locus=scaffold1326:199520:202634:- [translate_table: standard]
MEEWDILRSPQHDLSRSEVVDPLLQRIRAGDFDAVFMSPPCNTWSRAVHSNPRGPKPVRNKAHPRGFPWAEGKFKELAELGNILVDVCFTICNLACSKKVLRMAEHPEDLGASVDSCGRPVFPASIWQLPELFALLQQGWHSVAFFQCQFDVDRLKPTRLLGNTEHLLPLGRAGPPCMDAFECYAGPLPATCPHGGHPPLIKRKQSDPFHTTGTGVYPPAMDHALAQVIFQRFLETCSSKGGATSQEDGVTPGQEGRVTPPREDADGLDGDPLSEDLDGIPLGEEQLEEGGNTPGGKGSKTPEEILEQGSDFTEGGGLAEARNGVMRAFYKGKSRPVHDGLGLCSMGRQGARFRTWKGTSLAASLKREFWRMLDGWLDSKGPLFELKLVSSLLCGHVGNQPFGDLPDQIHGRWMKILRKAGKEGNPRAGDRSSAIRLRLLRILAEEVNDPDCSYLDEMAGQGVRLGAEAEVPRIPAVYEEKTKWFSVELNRSNAPWAFLKGEPFKVIASLELLAITVAVMVFAPESLWQGSAGRLCLTAFTDNQSNSYVLDKYMTTAFPLSVVLMELSVQLRLYGLELNLQWIPREQNCQADALTNLEFQEFSEQRRIPVSLENLKFRVLDKLINSAAAVDQEVALKKVSKEKHTHKTLAEKMRLTQPW